MIILAKNSKNIGVQVKAPSKVCEGDRHCPFHGEQNTRGREFVGTVIRSKVPRSVTVEWTGQRYIPKYERYEKTRSRVKAHCPECIGAVEGDTVRIMETRKISKTKNFVVIEKIEG